MNDAIALRFFDLDAPGARSRLCVLLSRLLLLLAGVEMVTMPVTQHFWMWDHFLHGGQDFETGLLAIVICCCLVLLRMQQTRQRLRLLLATGRTLGFPFRRHERLRTTEIDRARAARAGTDPPWSRWSPLPLRI